MPRITPRLSCTSPPHPILQGLLALAMSGGAVAQEPGGREKPVSVAAPVADEAAAAAIRERHARFTALMKDVKLVGSFTRDDDDTATPRREEYVISGATKVGTGDVWLVTSRIRYGTVDVTVPVPVEVKWAGETPVITLDEVTIPGLGTFSSRVVLDRGRYAGTWSHDKVGGHMFGTIVAAKDLADPPENSRRPAAPAAD